VEIQTCPAPPVQQDLFAENVPQALLAAALRFSSAVEDLERMDADQQDQQPQQGPQAAFQQVWRSAIFGFRFSRGPMQHRGLKIRPAKSRLAVPRTLSGKSCRSGMVAAVMWRKAENGRIKRIEIGVDCSENRSYLIMIII